MIRFLLLFILTVFQDRYVRLGTLVGLVAGFWSIELFRGELWVNMSIYGFIGWGIGTYLGFHFSRKTPVDRPPKLKVYQGGG